MCFRFAGSVECSFSRWFLPHTMTGAHLPGRLLRINLSHSRCVTCCIIFNLVSKTQTGFNHWRINQDDHMQLVGCETVVSFYIPLLNYIISIINKFTHFLFVSPPLCWTRQKIYCSTLLQWRIWTRMTKYDFIKVRFGLWKFLRIKFCPKPFHKFRQLCITKTH